MAMPSTGPTPGQAVGLTRLTSPFRAALRLAVDAALPPLCSSCREPLGDGEGLCAACWSKLPFIEPPYCARLGIPFTYDPGPAFLSMEAIANPSAYDRTRAPVRYDDVARALVHGFKYGDRMDFAPMMGHQMARAGHELLADAGGLVPVPLHWRRLWARRFNQSAALAGTISAIWGMPMLHGALTRVRATAQQVALSKDQRATNVQVAFKVLPSQKANVKGRRLILVDDVLTSGGRGRPCRRAGFRAGCCANSHAHITR